MILPSPKTEVEKRHNYDVRNIQQQVRRFFEQKKKFKIYHGSTNSTRSQRFDKDGMVDTSHLNRIIEINTEERYIIVEPNMSMDILIGSTLRYGLVPPVVMEFPGITVGGGIAGGAGESASFKKGLFHDLCVKYEIILGNGEVITASPQKNSDLYWGMACSYGSLGILTAVKIMLVPSKKYIRFKYQRVTSFENALSL